MRKDAIVMGLAALFISTAASAACVGSGSLYTCNDMSGNQYNVQKYGNMTHVRGYNAQTGSDWNQTSNTYGNTTVTQGTAANGNSWNSTETNLGGGTRIINGTDSNGQPFSTTCTQFGCM